MNLSKLSIDELKQLAQDADKEANKRKEALEDRSRANVAAVIGVVVEGTWFDEVCRELAAVGKVINVS